MVAGRGHQHVRRLVWRQPWQVGRIMEGVSTEETKPPSDGKQSGKVLEVGVAVGVNRKVALEFLQAAVKFKPVF